MLNARGLLEKARGKLGSAIGLLENPIFALRRWALSRTRETGAWEKKLRSGLLKKVIGKIAFGEKRFMRGQPAVEAIAAVTILLVVVAIVLALAFQRNDASNLLNQQLIERNSCQLLASAMQEASASPHNLQFFVFLNADANVRASSNTIFMPNDYCTFIANAHDANLNAGKVRVDKNLNGVFVSNAK